VLWIGVGRQPQLAKVVAVHPKGVKADFRSLQEALHEAAKLVADVGPALDEVLQHLDLIREVRVLPGGGQVFHLQPGNPIVEEAMDAACLDSCRQVNQAE
jgi:hypothetical protein